MFLTLNHICPNNLLLWQSVTKLQQTNEHMRECINHSTHTRLLNTIRDVYRLWGVYGLLWIPHQFLSNQELFGWVKIYRLGSTVASGGPHMSNCFSFTSIRDVYPRKKFKIKIVKYTHE